MDLPEPTEKYVEKHVAMVEYYEDDIVDAARPHLNHNHDWVKHWICRCSENIPYCNAESFEHHIILYRTLYNIVSSLPDVELKMLKCQICNCVCPIRAQLQCKLQHPFFSAEKFHNEFRVQEQIYRSTHPFNNLAN
uniref:Uncharacterized protein n=1 Tax=Panagrolaimus sp. ES5 TaxID=591445 RepID=A0AC34FTX6_9BILA